MAALATIEDLEAIRGRTLSGDAAQEARIGRLLEMASAAVRNYTDQYFELVADDEVVLWPDEMGRYRLPERPIVEVASVVDGNAVAVTDYRVDRDGFLLAGAASQPIMASWPGTGLTRFHLYPTGPLTVVYTHGYAVIPAEVVMVTCSVAVRTLVNPSGLKQRSVGDYSETFALPDSEATVTLVAPELRLLRTYRWEAV